MKKSIYNNPKKDHLTEIGIKKIIKLKIQWIDIKYKIKS